MEGFVLSDEEYVSEEDLSNLILQLIEMGALEVRGYDDISDQFSNVPSSFNRFR